MLSLVFILGLLPQFALAGWNPGTDAYQLNDTIYPWTDATLAGNNDTLTITTTESPSAPVRIHVTAPQGSTVTIQGQAGTTYSNLYITVDDAITLNVVNLSLEAPSGDGYNGISFNKENSPESMILNVIGDNLAEGFNGISSVSNHQLMITGSGTLTARGRASAVVTTDSGHGIYMKSDGTGATQPGAKLIVDGSVTLATYGGASVAASGGSGIFLDWGNMLVRNGSVKAFGGTPNGDRSGLPAGSGVTRRGGYGINLRGWGFPQPAGVLAVEGGQVTATGGNALAYDRNGDYFEGGRGILADTSVSISGGTVTTTGGIVTSDSAKGGDGLFTPALDVTGASSTLTAAGGASDGEGGIGLYVPNGITITAANVTATGGVGHNSEYGIYSPSGSVTIQDGAHVNAFGGNTSPAGTSGGIGMYAGAAIEVIHSTVTAIGGNGLNAGASGEPGIRAIGNITFTDSELTIVGGNGQVNGSHGVFSDTGSITVGSGSNVTVIGGDGQSGVGGVGLRAHGGGNGMTVMIAKDAGDVYVRGGIGALAQRESLRGRDILVGTGNIGSIVIEGASNPRSIKNQPGGDNVYMLTATTNPAAAAVVSAQVNGALAGPYTYRSPAVPDGIAYMWLPEGAWTASAAGYVSKTPSVTTDNAATVELPLQQTEATPAAVIDYSGEKLTGLVANAPYVINSASYTADADGKLSIEAGWLGHTVSIVKKGDGSTADSTAQSLGIPARPSAPAVTADDAGNVITGLDTTMEFSLDGGAYVKYTGSNAPNLTGTHAVRVRKSATISSWAGEEAALSFTPNPYSPPVTTVTNEPADTEVIVLVNGKAENAGKQTTTEAGGVKTTTVTVDPVKLQAKLDAEGEHAVVTIPVNAQANTVIGKLNGQMVKNMEDLSATLVLDTGKGSYRLPANEIGIKELSGKLGSPAALSDITVQLTIADTSADTVRSLSDAAKRDGFEVAGSPVEFTVTAASQGQAVEVKLFNVYVERTVTLPQGIDPGKITTGVVIEDNGSVRHVPTQVIKTENGYTAIIQSLTNSPYAVVWHPLTFADVEQHWAQDAVNDMGSRMVVNGVNATSFHPDADITRSEFAAILVRALGLPGGEGNLPFADVPKAGAVQTAASRGLIDGFEDGLFHPEEAITREQAMAILARAAKVTGLSAKIGNADPARELASFADGATAGMWAKDSIAFAAKAGLLTGRDGHTLAPQSHITRAETATLVQRLLKQSDLI